MLCVCLGDPPEKFDWQTRDKKNKLIRLTDLTPQDFYQKHSNVNLKDKQFMNLINTKNNLMKLLYNYKNFNLSSSSVLEYIKRQERHA